MINKSSCFATAVAATVLALSPVQAADRFISIAAGPVGITAYTWAAGVADVLNNHVDGVRASAEESKGYVDNVRLIYRGEVEVAFSTSLVAYDAYRSSGMFEGGEAGKILSWMSIAPVAQHVITLADGGIDGLADLQGKRIGMGQPGGTSMLDAEALTSALGLTPDADFEPFRVRLGNMVDMLGDGQLDVVLWNGSFPLPPVMKLTSQRDIQLLPIPDEVFATVQDRHPPYFRYEIPAGTYQGVDTPTPTYGLGNVMVISAELPEDLVYQMTKAVFENLDQLATVHPAFKRVSKESVLDGFGAPLHPGALKYYREVGVPGIEEFVQRTQ